MTKLMILVQWNQNLQFQFQVIEQIILLRSYIAFVVQRLWIINQNTSLGQLSILPALIVKTHLKVIILIPIYMDPSSFSDNAC